MKLRLSILFLLFAFCAQASQVEFFNGTLNAAKYKAGTEGKLVMIDFVADYCHLCKLMDETTYQDDKLVSYMKSNLVPLKINVDDFDGYVLKQQFNIKVLPTIIIFNSKGDVVARFEESMGATRMLSELKSFDIPENRKKMQIAAPAPELEEVKPVAVAPKPPVSNESAPTLQGLFEFSAKKHPKTGFGVQIGAFSKYGNVLIEVEKLNKLFSQQPVLVNISNLNGKTIYKLMLGSFGTHQEATNFQKTMQAKGIDGIIKDLTSI